RPCTSWWWAASSPASTRSDPARRAAEGRGGPMEASGPVIETERLVLRVPRIGDFDRFAELLGDEEAARHIGGHAPRGAAWRRFLQQPGAWMLQGFGMFSVIERASGRWVGQAGPWRPEGWPGNEIG